MKHPVRHVQICGGRQSPRDTDTLTPTAADATELPGKRIEYRVLVANNWLFRRLGT